MNWQPTATLRTLQQRASLLAAVRQFFSERGVMEVEVPALAGTTVSDVNLESLQVYSGSNPVGYLQTSPEYFMKRMLAAGSGAIYSLAKAFRGDETGAHHNPEFTMLEWYRPGFDDHALAKEVVDLCHLFDPGVSVQYLKYADLFEEHCGLNPHTASDRALEDLTRRTLNVDWQNELRTLWLEALFTHVVEPAMGDQLTVVADFPACQCALARLSIDAQAHTVARRFEVYWKGVELANGYWELCDVQEQKARFEQDNRLRLRQGKKPVRIDDKLLAAIAHGLPDCAGVALGIDRLLMCVTGKTAIDQVMSFTSDAAIL